MFAFTRLALLTGLILFSPNAFAKDPPVSAESKHIEELVGKAALEINQRGKAAFADFRVKGSAWFEGETYIFVYDLNGMILFNAAFPTAEGSNPVTNPSPPQGPINTQAYSKEFLETIKTKGRGWVGYMYRRPGTTEPAMKWAYITKVTIDGTPGLVGSGFYAK